ncbi:MAG: Na+/H+ antiporter subunit D [Fimbriimonadales bacterium]|nr:Na+/H+ antiporter subunit D [Fimbriimonadales bacterium]
MTSIVSLPIVIPLATAAGMLLVRRNILLQRVIGVVGSAALLAAAIKLLYVCYTEGIQVLQLGTWPAPFGISLVCDVFSGIMLVLAGIMSLTTSLYAVADIERRRTAFGFYSLLHILMMGICGAFLTGDLFNLYVWFEVMLIASFVLIALGGEKPQMEGAIKYVALNLIASMILVAAVGLVYGLTGSLNMADVAVHLRDVRQEGVVLGIAILFMAAFGIKAAVFPVFFWLPASYHTPPAAISAVFAGLLTKVGVYALIRTFTLIFTENPQLTHAALVVIAAATMLSGVLGAAVQMDFRRVLSFHIISQIGYMVLGLALFTPLAIAGAVFYILHHIIVKANLFFVSGVVHRLRGTYDLKKLGGLYATHVWLGVLFMIPAMSLAGIPPLSGFWAKLAIIRSGLEIEAYWVVGVALFVGLLTLYSMTKIWAEAFWKEPASPGPIGYASTSGLGWMVVPIVLLAAITVAIGLGAEPAFEVATKAGQELVNPQIYIDAVLGGRQ